MVALNSKLPFVLLDDTRPGGSAQLFSDLTAEVVATTVAEVVPALERLRKGGPHAGFIGFDAGYALEPVLLPLARTGNDGLPLLWFGEFARSEIVDATALLDDGIAQIGPVSPAVDEREYGRRVADVLALIAAGDIYQANLTFSAQVAVSGDPISAYKHLRAAAAAPYCALVHTGKAWVLSLSPELFFSLEAGHLTARPMKGTAARGATAAADDAAAAALAADPKNRAENLMIVDLLRNDFARIAVPASVAVPALFTVERYPTLLQMTSTITATTAASPVDVIKAVFPCGSITGAPKIRAMEVIASVEDAPRGLYTGSIGYISGANAAFNVAIRTLTMTSPGLARIGLGAGIVADSVAADEWRECLAKGAFLRRRPPPDLIETMRCDDGTILLLERHLARLAATADYLGYCIDLAAMRRELLAGPPRWSGRVRLLVSPRGAVAIQRSPLPKAVLNPVVALVPLPVDPSDWRLRHKTTDRSFYDDARIASQAFEVIFERPDGRLTEGSFTNIFVQREAVFLTPPLADGLLPGVLRAELIATGRAIEAPLTPADLTAGFAIGNALRGLVPAQLRSVDAVLM